MLEKYTDQLRRAGVMNFRYSFTTESPKQIRKVLSGDVAEFTNGHYKRGVE